MDRNSPMMQEIYFLICCRKILNKLRTNQKKEWGV
jgi:hypothetical protein